MASVTVLLQPYRKKPSIISQNPTTTWKEWSQRLDRIRGQYKLEIKDQNTIGLWMAKRRTGKTTKIVKYGRKLMEKGEMCYFNQPLILPPYINPKYYGEFKHVEEVCYKKKCHIFIDEGTEDFDCHDWQSTPHAVRTWISNIGKFQQAVYVVVQVAKQIDVAFRDQCDYIDTISRPFPRILHSRRWTREGILDPKVEPEWTSEDILMSWLNPDRWTIMDLETFAMFDTRYSLIDFDDMNMTKREKEMRFKMAWEKEKQINPNNPSLWKK